CRYTLRGSVAIVSVIVVTAQNTSAIAKELVTSTRSPAMTGAPPRAVMRSWFGSAREDWRTSRCQGHFTACKYCRTYGRSAGRATTEHTPTAPTPAHDRS